jgi:hypothetical protein
MKGLLVNYVDIDRLDEIGDGRSFPIDDLIRMINEDKRVGAIGSC